MKIEIIKKSRYQCEYTISRNDGSVEVITLDTKTYLLHDISHFVVEKTLGFKSGFWGMLSQGHSFKELFVKDNPETGELRFVEQVVGPVQSVVSGHIPLCDFGKSIEHLDFKIPENNLGHILNEIRGIMDDWKRVEVGERFTLKWY